MAEIVDDTPAREAAAAAASGGSGITMVDEGAVVKTTAPFQFEFDEGRKFASFADRDNAENLAKWGIPVNVMQGLHFRFDETFRRGMAEEFLCALFNSAAFRGAFQLADGRGGSTAFCGPARVTKVKHTPLLCSHTTLDLFDRVMNDEIVRKASGAVCKMADVFLPRGVTVADQLRGVFMLGEDSEYYDTFSETEQSEFLYHVMWRLVAGGALNQYEDDFSVYKNVCRDVYRDLVSVARVDAGGAGDVEGGGGSGLAVQSLVYQVHAAAGSDGLEVPLFPVDDESRNGNHNFMYVSIHPTRRACTVWYNGFWSPF